MALLRAARESAGVSLRELEERTGISRGNLSRLETGESNPTVATLRRYAAAIGKTVSITIK
jgi:transcriptional regulator with XRE-family HTH domain